MSDQRTPFRGLHSNSSALDDFGLCSSFHNLRLLDLFEQPQNPMDGANLELVAKRGALPLILKFFIPVVFSLEFEPAKEVHRSMVPCFLQIEQTLAIV